MGFSVLSLPDFGPEPVRLNRWKVAAPGSQETWFFLWLLSGKSLRLYIIHLSNFPSSKGLSALFILESYKYVVWFLLFTPGTPDSTVGSSRQTAFSLELASTMPSCCSIIYPLIRSWGKERACLMWMSPFEFRDWWWQKAFSFQAEIIYF